MLLTCSSGRSVKVEGSHLAAASWEEVMRRQGVSCPGNYQQMYTNTIHIYNSSSDAKCVEALSAFPIPSRLAAQVGAPTCTLRAKATFATDTKAAFQYPKTFPNPTTCPGALQGLHTPRKKTKKFATSGI